jgi:periplasmic divalent cation tolerance protein
MDLVSVYVTCPDEATARRLARQAVETRLAACANVFPIASVYRWEGALQEEPEVAMLLKTRRDRVEALTAALREAHPAEVPCIVAFPLVGGHAPYLAWVAAESAP